MKEITIVKISIIDIHLLQKIGKKTFFETFSESNSEENMHVYLDMNFSIEKLTSEILNPSTTFYFAKLYHDVIGYLKLNSGDSQTELKDSRALEIERIYVLKEYHGNKVGQMLYDKAIDQAKQMNLDFVWLGVWEENLRAIAFYKKNGFVEFDKHIFNLGDDEQIDIMMKRKL